MIDAFMTSLILIVLCIINSYLYWYRFDIEIILQARRFMFSLVNLKCKNIIKCNYEEKNQVHQRDQRQTGNRLNKIFTLIRLAKKRSEFGSVWSPFDDVTVVSNCLKYTEMRLTLTLYSCHHKRYIGVIIIVKEPQIKIELNFFSF